MPNPVPAETNPDWSDASAPVAARVQALLDDLGEQERAALVLADFSPLTRRGISYPDYVDSGTGLRGVPHATAFPVGIALAATFDDDVARRYGAAVAREARRAGFTCVLGPTVDIARDPRGGRIPEALGEDAWLSGALGAAHVRGIQGEHVIAQVKHYLAYGTEERRTGHGPVWRRGEAVDVTMPPGALDLYLQPFRAVIEAGAWSLMGSYNRVNGTYVCQSRELLDIPRRRWGWEGFYAPDFIFAVRDPRAALDAGLDLPGLEGAAGRTADMVREAGAAQRDSSARHILNALFGSGVVDDPPRRAEVVSSPDHLDLAREVAVSATVLLHNSDVLPLGASVRRLAVIGPAGTDAMYTSGGSSAVELDLKRIVTPVDAIRQRAASHLQVVTAQGTLGDIPLPAIPPSVLSLPDGSGPGVEVHRVGLDQTQRVETLPDIDITLSPDEVDTAFPALFRCRLTPERTGPHRLSLDLGGGAVVRIDGTEVMAGAREASPFFQGPACPLQCVVDLTVGQPVDVEIEADVASGLVVPEMGLLPRIVLGWQPPAGLIEEATELAASADVAIVVVNMSSSEGMDRAGLGLPGDQDALIEAVAAANRQTVVVLNTPGAVVMPWLDDVAAVLQVWYPGEQFGPALASMLFGDASPGGRLPLTFPRSVHDLPGGDRRPGESPAAIELTEGTRIGYRAVGVLEHGPLFPFGFGLGYGLTRHEVRAVRASRGIEIDLTVTNDGALTATHVLQAYVHPSVEPGQRYLCGVARAQVSAGSSIEVTLRVEERSLDEVAPAGLRRLLIATHASDPGVIIEEPPAEAQAAARTTTSHSLNSYEE